MALKLLKDITYPDYPEIIEVRVVNKWYTRNNTRQFSYLFVDVTGYGIEALAPSTDESHLDKMVMLQHCYKITNYTTVKGITYAPVVPHPTSIKISRETRFQLVTNENIPNYYFNFVPLDKLEDHLTRGSSLSDVIGRAESITDMIPTTERKTGKSIYLRRVIIMDDRSRTVEVTLWEDMGRTIDKVNALHNIVAVTATYASKFSDNIQLTSTNATRFFIDPPIPNLQQLKERFSSLPHVGATTPHNIVPLSTMQTIVINDLHTKSHPEFDRVQFSCDATIAEIFSYRSWYYLACQHCPRSVNKEMTKQGDVLWRCLNHGTMDKPTQLYALNTIITDDNGSTEAIFFNRAVEQLTGISCHELITRNNCVDPKVLPPEIKSIEGQRKQLQVSIKVDSTVNVNNILDPQTPPPLPHTNATSSSTEHPTTPAPKQQRRNSQCNKTPTSDVLPASKKSKACSQSIQD